MKKIIKEVKLFEWYNYTKIFSDAEDNKYRWFSFTHNHSCRQLRFGRVEKELKLEEGILLTALVKQVFDDPHNYSEITYVKLNYTEEFLNKHLENIIRSKNDNRVDIFNLLAFVRIQKLSEDSCIRLLNLVKQECPSNFKQFSQMLSKFQKLSEDFIINNLDLLDIKYLKLSHLPQQAQFRLKMMRELT